MAVIVDDDLTVAVEAFELSEMLERLVSKAQTHLHALVAKLPAKFQAEYLKQTEKIIEGPDSLEG